MVENISASIVIASFSSVDHLERCLNSISIQTNLEQVEVIVSTCLAAEDVHLLQQRFDVRFVFNPDEQDLDSALLRETRVFRLRSSGVKAAKGKIVMLLEDHCEVAPAWLRSMLGVLADENCIAGGPIANGAEQGLFRCALYWSEYAAMMPPFPAGEVDYLSAVNSAYYRSALDVCQQVWQDGFYDNEVHDALMEQGAKLCLAPDAIVYTRLPFTFKQALVHLFTGGRRYGGYRGGSQWSMHRAIRLFSTLLVPAVLCMRILKTVRLRQPDRLPTFILSLPVLYVLLSAWGSGELLGTLRGEQSIKHNWL